MGGQYAFLSINSFLVLQLRQSRAYQDAELGIGLSKDLALYVYRRNIDGTEVKPINLLHL